MKNDVVVTSGDLMAPMMTVDQIDVKLRSVGGRQCMTARGRDVHEFLDLAKKFADWMPV